MKKTLSWKESIALKIRLLDWGYKDLAEKWKDKDDDRKLFSNLYFILTDALKKLPARPLPNVFCVAINAKYDEYRKTMDEIKDRFAGRD